MSPGDPWDPALRPNPHVLHCTSHGPGSFLGPDPCPRSREARDPNSSELRQSDVTHRTPGKLWARDPRAPRVPPATALTAEDHGGRGAHDREKGGVLGAAALDLGHVCGWGGGELSRPRRGENQPGEASRQLAAGARRATDAAANAPGQAAAAL